MRQRVLEGLGLLLGLGLLFLSTEVRSPYGSSLRPWVTPTMVLLGVAAALLFYRRESRFVRFAGAALGVLIAVSAAGTELGFAFKKQRVLDGGERLDAIGRHLVVGYRDVTELEELMSRVDIGGIFVTARNVRGKSVDQVRSEIARLRNLATSRGVELWVTADQEGGVVTRLSPPLEPLDALGSIATDQGALREGWRETVHTYSDATAAGLERLGVNVNFAPVVDLRDESVDPTIDLHSRIADRAISSDPEVISRVSQAYSERLREHGILAVAKHFPGLGRVNADTHHVTGHLTTDLKELQAQEWVPFEALAINPPVGVMVGHVIVDSLDPTQVASASATLVGEVLRGSLRHDGLTFTDDLCMSPVYYGPGGLVGHARRSLLAGVDYLLVTFDPSLVYPLLDGLTEGPKDSALDAALARSERRIAATRSALTAKHSRTP